MKGETTITFRLKCEPRIKMTAPAELVTKRERDCGITFFNEFGSPQTIVMLDEVWEIEK